jgi:hypothetical protein
MAAIAGIKTTKNTKGQITHITVDVRKHKKVIPMFNEIGLMPKTKFQQKCEKGTPIEEAFEEIKAHIKSLWQK